MQICFDPVLDQAGIQAEFVRRVVQHLMDAHDQRARMDASMRRVYDLFRGRVAEGRDMKIEEVDKLGRGHVYSGTDAHAAAMPTGRRG